MEPKDIKITIPKGYEIDMEKSSFERIVFKKKKNINSWEDLGTVKGCYIDDGSEICCDYEDIPDEYNKNVFLNEKYAISALAMAQISQLLPYYDSEVDWDKDVDKYCILRVCNNIYINVCRSSYHLLAFNSEEEARRFLKYNEQLVKNYFML